MKNLFLLGAASLLCGSACAATYYVAPNGSDTATGTSLEAPFKTVQVAVDRATAGDTVMLRAGTYREEVLVRKNGGTAEQPLTLASYNGERAIIKGSDLVTGWVAQGNGVYKKTGWSINSQQVFVDFDEARPQASLQQIGMPSRFYTSFEYPKPAGTGVSDMGPGSFYYDPAATTLYVRLADGSDPNQHQIEVSTRKSLLTVSKPYVQIKNLAFRHSSVSGFMQQGGAVLLASYNVMDGCDVQWTDFAGINMGYQTQGVQVINSNVSNNGDSGVNGPASYAFRVAGTTMNYNNNRGFNPLWHAGGLKATTKGYGTVENNEVAGNNGSGIWFDYANGGQPIIVRNNFVHDNGPVDSAIFFEVSNNGQIYNNVLANNARRGIYLSGSDNTRVYNNTIYGTKTYAGIELGGLPREGATLTNNQVYNNIISHGSTRYDLIIMPANGGSIAGNVSDYNNFYRPGGSIALTYSTGYTALPAWQSATQMDGHSLSVDPRFSNPGTVTAATDLSLRPDSQLLAAGRTPEDTGTATTAATTTQGAYPIGATNTAAASPNTRVASRSLAKPALTPPVTRKGS